MALVIIRVSMVLGYKPYKVKMATPAQGLGDDLCPGSMTTKLKIVSRNNLRALDYNILYLLCLLHPCILLANIIKSQITAYLFLG